VRSSAGIADLSYRAKFETRAPAEGAWRLGAERYLVVGEPPVAAPADAFDISGVYASLLLAGPRSRDVLGKLTSLNTSEVSLANRNCAQASVAHVHAIVLREDIGALPAFHLLIARDYAESVWEAVLHAGEEFHLQPFGLDALRLLGA
jgi:heterotetrameric sarcosine oxidase gamma subunit